MNGIKQGLGIGLGLSLAALLVFLTGPAIITALWAAFAYLHTMEVGAWWAMHGRWVLIAVFFMTFAFIPALLKRVLGE